MKLLAALTYCILMGGSQSASCNLASFETCERYCQACELTKTAIESHLEQTKAELVRCQSARDDYQTKWVEIQGEHSKLQTECSAPLLGEAHNRNVLYKVSS